MQLALSTLGLPGGTVAEAAGLAAAHGFSGLELRSGPDATVSVAAPPEQRHRWRADLAVHGVQPLALATYVKLCDESRPDDAVVDDGIAHLQLARDLGARWVRVFAGGRRGVPCPPALEEVAAGRLAALAAASERLGVELALETHDSHPTAAGVVRLLDASGRTDVAVIWDVLHTWLGGEDPERTADLLAGRLAYLQVKDVAGPDDLAPLPLGTGVLPARRCLDLAAERRLCTWVSWEYERVWHPEAPPLAELAASAREWMTGTWSTPPADPTG